MDYTHPFGADKKLETGIKSSSVSTDNNSKYWNVLNGVDVTDTALTNHFIYEETIYSCYLNYAHKINKKLSVQAGVRAEETQSKGQQIQNNIVFKRQYLRVFPSAFLSWQMDSLNALNVSYSRRIVRPDYSELNPFRFYNNPYNYYGGNSNLLPQMLNNFELTHSFKGVFNTTFGYSNMTNVIAKVVHQDDVSHVTYTLSENLKTYNSFNILLSLTSHITKWWTSMNSVNASYNRYSGEVLGGYYSQKQITYVLNTQNSFMLKKDWSTELGFFYRSKNLDGLLIQKPIFSLDAGIRKTCADGKLSFALNFSDILWSTYQNQSTVFGNVNTESSGRHDTRRVRLSVSWKFGRSQYERNDQKKSAEEELDRAR